MANSLEFPALRSQIRTRAGVTIDTRASEWIFPDATVNTCINFALLPPMHQTFQQSIRYLTAFYVENYAASTAANSFWYLKHFFDFCFATAPPSKTEITSIDLINYREGFGDRPNSNLTNVSGSLKRWHRLRLPGLTADAVTLLKTWRLKGLPKGVAVATLDPYKGPFSEIEFQAIHVGIDEAYEQNTITGEQYCLIWLTIALALRPSQIAALKISDLSVCVTDSEKTYFLTVPRVKQRHRSPRDEFSKRVLSRKVGENLLEHIEELKQTISASGLDVSSSAMFPASKRMLYLLGYENHRTAVVLGTQISKVIAQLKVTSERTAQPLRATATRFRRTFGTRLAAEGHGELIIAELLDHSDTQNVGVYVQANSRIVDRIDRAVALRMAPLAQAFAGVVIARESEAIRGKDPSSRIADPRFDEDLKPMGSCGKHGFCGFLTPIACYTCINFQPWIDGPHEAVLNYLISERERILPIDVRVATVNDRTILAVANVITLCEAKDVNTEGGDACAIK